MLRSLARAGAPVLVVGLMCSVSSPVGAQSVPAAPPATSTTTSVVAATTTIATIPATTSTVLPPDDLTPVAVPPAGLPPVAISPVGAGGNNAAVNPADLAALAALANAAANVPIGDAAPQGLIANLSASRGADRKLSVAVTAYDSVSAGLVAAQAHLDAASAAYATSSTELDKISGDQQVVAAQAASARARLQRLAAVALTADDSRLSAVFGASSPAEARARLTSIESITDAAAHAARDWTTRRAQLDGSTRAAAQRTADAQEGVERATVLRDAAQAAVTTAEAQLSAAQVAAGVGPRSVPDIPNRVLVAYIRAAQWSAAVDPTCHMTWWALAAIGRVESGHAGGVAVAPNGQTVPRILGIPLDGTHGTATILDTDGGQFDGDTVYDRAVGPMQFIPGTWRSAGVDASGDGVADPNNVYDAAFAAARYLCAGAGGRPVDTEAGFRVAAFSYNHSGAYVDKVWDGSAGYRAIAAGIDPTVPTTTVPGVPAVPTVPAAPTPTTVAVTPTVGG